MLRKAGEQSPAFFVCSLSFSVFHMLLSKPFVKCAFLALGFCGYVHGVMAAEGPIATLGDVAVYTDDLKADLLRVPENGRQAAASDPTVVQQAAANLVLRKAMAVKAHQGKLDQDPAIQSQLSLLQQRILSDAWLAEVDRKAALPQAEVERLAELKYRSEAFTRFKYPAQVKVRHILVPKGEDGKSQVEDLVVQLKAGADFGELAKRFSKDPGSAARGGELGVVTPGKMVPEFEKAAFALKNVGELSPPVESTFGYHIIRLDQRDEGQIAPYSEVKDGLIQEIMAKQRADARNVAMAEMFKQISLSQEAIERFVAAAKASPQ